MRAEEAGEPLLRVELDGAPLGTFTAAELPSEKKASAPLRSEESSLVFRQPNGSTYTHTLCFEKGWGHFSVRVHENLACQADFAAHPELRPREYYGNSFFGQHPLSFEDNT